MTLLMSDRREPDPHPLELSDMTPVMVDSVTLERFFEELAFETSVRGVVLRGENLPRRKEEGWTLREARDRFRTGKATGVQIHYVHRGVDWWDTLMWTDAGVRRVRIKKVGEKLP